VEPDDEPLNPATYDLLEAVETALVAAFEREARDEYQSHPPKLLP